jgi:large subunit ribosomal protein L30
MAEQSSRDVVDQTLSGGEPSPSDVPANTNDNLSAGGDAGKTEHIAMNTATSNNSRLRDQQNHETTDMLDSQGERTGSDKDAVGSATVSFAVRNTSRRLLTWAQDNSKQGAGVVATRVLELNGIASASDGGDDTASQGGSESDASRTDSRNHARSGSVKKPGSFKPVSFAKFSVPKVAGAPTPPKVPEKGMFFVKDCLMTITDLFSALSFNYTTRYPAAKLSTTTCRKDYRRDA